MSSRACALVGSGGQAFDDWLDTIGNVSLGVSVVTGSTAIIIVSAGTAAPAIAGTAGASSASVVGTIGAEVIKKAAIIGIVHGTTQVMDPAQGSEQDSPEVN